MPEETAVTDRPIDQPRPLAVVTGASSGIGLELAQCFADGGFDLLLTALEADVSLVADRLGGEVATRAVQADLSTVEGVETLLAEVRALGRPVDALALNAGTAQGGRFVETPLDGELETIRLNVESTVRLAKALLPAMVERGAGRVLVTSSTAATQPGPYYATYAASKSFLTSFAEAVRYELKDTGVTVTVLAPGPTDTDFFAQAGMEDTTVADSPKDDPADVARQGYEALMKGKDKVEVHSLKARMQTAAAAVLPDKAKAAMHAAYTKPKDD
jgi:short-subunit dehydrogenase